MDEQPNDLSRAILIYEGWDYSSFPLSDSASVVENFGPAGKKLLEQIAEIDQQISGLPPDWSKESLAEATQRMSRAIKAIHPELDEKALRALEWGYQHGWK